ncbi:Galactose oxidase, central domain [Carpediemonas membranifera]|uniref:Galactose oxidase, central domain n=1 Tax=Carpediemonas membranifera TaxID=201153 RepID=A0A8J6B0M5_9EUKA|nr:Galactose oxidase, central domain [Carpediemonas membranifera]|eukprot:KAG9391729.1 Galactose oxidase, central domain [Carpediemonas membranifera]
MGVAKGTRAVIRLVFDRLFLLSQAKELTPMPQALIFLLLLSQMMVVFAFPGTPFSETAWTELGIASAPQLQSHTTVAMNNLDDILVFGGSDGGPTVSCELYWYNTALDAWEAQEPIPTGYCVMDHTTVLYNGFAYTFGGKDDSTVVDSLVEYEFDPTMVTNGYHTVIAASGTAPTARMGHVAAVREDGANSYMLVFGGMGAASPFNDLYKYTFATTTWTSLTVADPPEARAYSAGAMRDDGCFFLFGGINPSTNEYYDDFYMYCEGDASWTMLNGTDAPTQLRGASMWTYDGRVMVFGGYSGIWPNDYSSAIYEYNEYHNSWHTVSMSTVPTARYVFGLFHRDDGSSIADVYIVSGRTKYIIESDVWATAYVPIHCPAGQYSGDGITCTDCPVGTYAPTDGMYACLNCSDGTYQDTEGQAVCTECPAGYYGNGTAMTTLEEGCLACPTGTENPYTGMPDLADCTACPAGSYADANGTATCTNCTAGYYSSVVGADDPAVCTECQEAEYAPSGSSECLACPAGTASDQTGQETCPDCPEGYWSAEGSTECSTCPEGEYSAGGGTSTCTPCPVGTYNNITGQNICADCPTGTYNPSTGSDDISSCLACGIGTYQPNTGASDILECVSCLPGTYNDQTGQEACTDCARGYYNPSTGSVDISACLECSAGTYNNFTGQPDVSACLTCDVGTYSAAAAPLCTDCPAGTYNPDLGMTTIDDCHDCVAYKYSDPGAEFCLSCGPTEWSPEGSAVCYPCTGDPDKCECGAGQYRAIDASGNCHDCIVGYYCVIGEKLACPEGQMSFGNASYCFDCLDGWVCDSGVGTPCFDGQYALNHETCEDCIPGAACNAGALFTCPAGSWGNGTEWCYSCLPGTITATDGMSSCDTCPDGTTSNYRRDACVDCPAGEYSVGGVACMSCPVGTYNPTPGSSNCDPCPVDTYGEVMALKACHDCPTGTTTGGATGVSDPALCV